MQRRYFLRQLCVLTLTGLGLPACARSEKANATSEQGSSPVVKLNKPSAEWRQLLPPQAYAVLFEEATERPFSSSLNNEKRQGTFVCAACYLPLFGSDAKFDSGTGWPSFFQPLPGRIGTKTDYKLILPRTEYHCIRCGGHQGHVFDDGPPPTGQRWCNNGVALNFVPAGEPLPALRT
jgi:peptide-methionine (R)-S-oxide reductase